MGFHRTCKAADFSLADGVTEHTLTQHSLHLHIFTHGGEQTQPLQYCSSKESAVRVLMRGRKRF